MDVEVVETGNGGDLLKRGNDLGMVYSIENMVYLSLFGGNVEQDTPTTRPEAQQAFDWWGNALLMGEEPDTQFNSRTERTLRQVALNGQGRQAIQQAINDDLKHMQPYADITVQVTIVAVDRVRIGIRVKRPDNLESTELVYIWDALNFSLIPTITAGYYPNPTPFYYQSLQYDLQTAMG